MSVMQSDREFLEFSTAVPDWEERIMQGKSLIPEVPLYDAVAEKALRIFKRLRVPDLIGKPTFGEISEPWLFDFVRLVFGTYDPETKARVIQEFFLMVPKKNTKTTISAAIMVTAMIMNERPLAEAILVASTQEVSGRAFSQAAGMIRADAELSKMFHIKTHLKTIKHRVTEAEMKVLAADGDVVTGSIATYVLIDETHILGAKDKAPEIFLELRGGLQSRPEGFLLQITTQSKKRPVGQFKKELEEARGVRDGKISAPMAAVLYELPFDVAKDNGWKDQKLWGLVNPNMGRSTSFETLLDKYEKAEREGADSLALFASQYLNVQIGQGTTDGRWVGAQYWPEKKAIATEVNSLADLMAVCEVIVAGLDGGGMDDLLGLTFLGRHAVTKRWLSWSKAWAHEIALERRKSIAPELKDFAEDGDLVICEHPTQDVDEIVELLKTVLDAGLFPEQGAVGLDPEGVAALVDAAVAAGLTMDQLQAVTQGYKLNGAIKGAERKLFDGSLQHAAQPVMDWCVSNAATENRGNAVVVTKAASGVGKIDPLMALFNAFILMSRNPVAAQTTLSIPDDYVV